MIYLQLFLSFLQVGAFSFGGGYAAMPLIREQVITAHSWLSMEEFTDLITISQMTPGPIAINSATFVGTRVGGFWGALCATTGCVLPSCLLVSLLAWAYLKYGHLSIIQDVLSSLRPAVIAMIASAGFSILISILWPQGLSSLAALAQNVNLRGFLIFLGALVLLIRLRMNPILVMVLSGAAEVLCQLALRLIDV